jgi:hypothetical protein
VKKNPAKANSSGDCFIFRGHILNESSLVALIAYFGYFGLAIQTPIVIDSLETMLSFLVRCLDGKSFGMFPIAFLDGKSFGMFPIAFLDGKSFGMFPIAFLDGKSCGMLPFV